MVHKCRVCKIKLYSDYGFMKCGHRRKILLFYTLETILHLDKRKQIRINIYVEV
jgi:hypothetical protein